MQSYYRRSISNSFLGHCKMFLLIKLTALFFILAINTLSVSAEDVSKISEETFKDKVEVLPSPIKDTIKPKSLMSTELSKSTPKTTHTKVLDPALKKINSDSSTFPGI